MKTRREFMAASAGLAALPLIMRAAGSPFRYSICSEVFFNDPTNKRDFQESCRLASRMGYSGIEIAPFTLAESVRSITPSRRKELRDIIHSEGLQFAGLHWLMVSPAWLHITTSDSDLRERSWAYFQDLIDFCGDLREGQPEPAVMVLGSPKQRSTVKGTTVAEATERLIEGLASVAEHASDRRAIIAMEALDHSQSDVVNTLAECAEIVRKVHRSSIQTMFDFHNTPDEKETPERLVNRYFSIIKHVHINEMDGRHPGTGHSDYVPLMRVLRDRHYGGWVSLEVFDFKLGAERIGREALNYLKSLESII